MVGDQFPALFQSPDTGEFFHDALDAKASQREITRKAVMPLKNFSFEYKLLVVKFPIFLFLVSPDQPARKCK